MSLHGGFQSHREFGPLLVATNSLEGVEVGHLLPDHSFHSKGDGKTQQSTIITKATEQRPSDDLPRRRDDNDVDVGGGRRQRG